MLVISQPFSWIKRIKPLLCDEWIELSEDEPIADEADWIVCDN